MSSEASLPSVNYANYKRAIRGSKKKREDNKKQPVKELPKPTIVWQPRRSSSSTSTSSNSSKKKRDSTSASNLSDFTGIRRNSSRTSIKSSNKSSNQTSNNNNNKESSIIIKTSEGSNNNNKKQRIDNPVEEGFEVFNNSKIDDNENASDDLHLHHQDLIIEPSFSGQTTLSSVVEDRAAAADDGFEVFEREQSCEAVNDELLPTNTIVEYIMHSDNNKQDKPQTVTKEEEPESSSSEVISNNSSILDSLPSASDLIELAKSISYTTNDDSIFSKEGPRKGSPQRSVVMHTTTDDNNPSTSTTTKNDDDDDDPSRVSPSAKSSAIDMSGCIRTAVSSPSSSQSESSSRQKLEFPKLPNSIHTKSSEQPQNPTTSGGSSNHDSAASGRWQEFGSSLTLLGTPVMSWFSTTTNTSDDDGVVVVANDQDIQSPPSQESNKGMTFPNATTNNNVTKPKEEEVAGDKRPKVDDDMTGISTLASSSEAFKKPSKAPSSLSSTDGGSLSIVGEVPSKSPKVEISFPISRQLSRFFSSSRNSIKSPDDNYDGFSANDGSLRTSWNKVTTCIPSKRDNPQRFYLFLFGISMITSAIILSMILLLLVLTSPNSSTNSAILAGNSSMAPSFAPTVVASMVPSDNPSMVPSNTPTNTPTITPRPTSSQVPSEVPSDKPTDQPSYKPTNSPTITAVPTSEPLSYVPGKLTVKSNGLLLSEGLTSRIVARSGQKVLLDGRRAYYAGNNNTAKNASSVSPTSEPTAWTPVESEEVFHFQPDGAAAYPWPENEDYGGNGWIYVSNSEVWDKGGGGVGAIYFDDKGRVVDYQSLIQGTTANCAGGKTPWHTWVTCEEADDGRIYQIDPLGIRPPEEMTIGMGRGKWESFAYDIRNPNIPRFFATEDKDSGTLRRFTPNEPDWDDPWTMLQANGTVDFLVLEPFDYTGRTSGTFHWTNDLRAAKENARRYFQHSEGIDIRDNQLFVVSKTQKELFILDLDAMTYEVHSTVFGLFDGQPDQMKRLVSDDDKAGTMHDKSLLYFCEEGGKNNGVHARDSNGWYFTILESDELDGETSGLAFSPDGKHMYFSYQHRGIIFDVWREDGRPFHAKTLSVKYHETGEVTSR